MYTSPSPFASLGTRFLAFFLDLMILAIPCAVANHIIPLVGGLIVLFFYAPVLEASRIQATLGKYLIGIQVTNRFGHRASLRDTSIRNAVKYVTIPLLFFGFFFAFFTQRKQALHDLLAETLVTNGKSDASVSAAWTDSARDVFHSGFASERVHSDSIISQLERLQALRDKGAISQEEFEEQKKRILSSEN